ncbi:hypothetical protein Gotur_027196 [Gossypium turneri]
MKVLSLNHECILLTKKKNFTKFKI